MLQDLNERLQRWGFSRAGLLDNRHGEWWMIAQMALIAAHALPPWPPLATLGIASWPVALRLAGGLTLLIGLAIGAQGTVSLGESLSPLPEPIPGSPLVTEGAYGRCRHPLYQSLLVCSLGITLLLASPLHLALLLALAVVLGLKARREEGRLEALHPDYTAYRQSTPAIIPHLPGLDWRGNGARAVSRPAAAPPAPPE